MSQGDEPHKRDDQQQQHHAAHDPRTVQDPQSTQESDQPHRRDRRDRWAQPAAQEQAQSEDPAARRQRDQPAEVDQARLEHRAGQGQWDHGTTEQRATPAGQAVPQDLPVLKADEKGVQSAAGTPSNQAGRGEDPSAPGRHKDQEDPLQAGPEPDREAEVQPGREVADLSRPGESGLPQTIAIDGPAGAGKSTIGRMLAERLGYLFLDTGAMYRAVALAALDKGIAVTDGVRLADLAEHLPIIIEKPRWGESDGRAYSVILEGRDVTWDIRRPEVEAVVSPIAAWPQVRVAMVRQQRRMAEKGPVVMVGRDITTEVLPHADLKIYLDASIDERARRRCDELHERGVSVGYDQVRQEIAHRDDLDMHREAGALKRAPDAVAVNTDGLEIPQSLDKLSELVENWKRQTPA